MKLSLRSFALIASLAGCLDNGPPPPTAAASPVTIERTIVTLLADGSERVSTQQIRAADHQAELAAHAQFVAGTASRGTGEGQTTQSLASVDGSCAGSSMWIFDADNNAIGTGLFSHEICFFKSSTAFPICADLRQYRRLCTVFGSTVSCQNWAADNGNWIGSYWAGQTSGMYLDVNGAVQQGFGAYFRQDNAQLTIPRATYLCFPN
jgi:hypothetical protein